MKPSTKAFFRLHGWRNFIDFLHGYIYVRWINNYLKVITGKAFKRRKRRAGTLPSNPGYPIM